MKNLLDTRAKAGTTRGSGEGRWPLILSACQSSLGSSGTTMSEPRLPPETLDSIIDFLHDDHITLRWCCLVSKSWVPRTRTHLFADIQLESPGDLKAWMKAFPDPVSSPGCYTCTLAVVGFPCLFTGTNAEESGWIRAFSNVTQLLLWSGPGNKPLGNLAPFHRFSPTLKSLRVVSNKLSFPATFNLIRSFPLLKNLSIKCLEAVADNDQPLLQPSTSPVLTGTLELYLPDRGTEHIARQLLGVSSGLHFREFVWRWRGEEDARWVAALVEACSDTLERIDIISLSRMSSQLS